MAKSSGRSKVSGSTKRLGSDKLIQALNQQVGNEMHASMQYIAIAAHFDAENLPRLAALFYRQADEERMHSMKFVRHVVDLGGRLAMPAIAAPKPTFATAAEAVALSLKWEHTVTGQIYDLVDIAKGDRDYISMRFLDWFVSEQLEEINSMETLLSLVERAGEDNLLLVEDYIAQNAIGDSGNGGKGEGGEGGGK
ncbi:MAG: ferritin [Thermoanaerobaculia bacterium]